MCVDSDDPAAWKEFVARSRPMLIGVLKRTCARYGLDTAANLDDFLQEVYLKIAANRGQLLRKFASQQSDTVFGYLKIVAVNVVVDHCRMRHAVKRRSIAAAISFSEDSSFAADDRGAAQRELERTLLMKQIDGILEQQLTGVTARRDHSIFWLYYRQGMTARMIAAIHSLDLSVKGVETVIHRLTQIVRTQLAIAPTRIEGVAAGNPLSGVDEV